MSTTLVTFAIITRPAAYSRTRWLLVGAACATLPWLSTKYAPMSAVLVAVALGRIVFDTTERRARGPFDAAAIVVPYGLSLLVASLLHIADWPPAVAAGGIVLGVALLTAFVGIERRRADPLIPVTLLRRSAVEGPLIALLVIQFGVLAVTVYVVLYLQQSLDYGPLGARRDAVVEKHVKGVEFLMKKNAITVLYGTGTLTGPTSVHISGGESGDIDASASDLIIATGSVVRPIPGFETDGKQVVKAIVVPGKLVNFVV